MDWDPCTAERSKAVAQYTVAETEAACTEFLVQELVEEPEPAVARVHVEQYPGSGAESEDSEPASVAVSEEPSMQKRRPRQGQSAEPAAGWKEYPV